MLKIIFCGEKSVKLLNVIIKICKNLEMSRINKYLIYTEPGTTYSYVAKLFSFLFFMVGIGSNHSFNRIAFMGFHSHPQQRL